MVAVFLRTVPGFLRARARDAGVVDGRGGSRRQTTAAYTAGVRGAASPVDKPKRFDYVVSVVKVRDMLKRLADDGWVIVRQRGSHRQLQHPIKPGTVTVSGHPSETLRPGTYFSVLDKAKLEDRR